MERDGRGTSSKLIIKGENTKRPADWKKFLTNDENKQQFIEVILKVWSSNVTAPKLLNRKIVMTFGEKAFHLTSENGKKTVKSEVESLSSTQEETDSRVILYCFYAKEQGYRYVRVKSPDIFFICLHYAMLLDGIQILFDTGRGDKKQLINITQLASQYTQEYCTALMCLHAYTRCDTTSRFKGVGRVKPIKILQRMPRFQSGLAQLGESWQVTDELFSALEGFTCMLYGSRKILGIDDLREVNLMKKCGNELNSSRNVGTGSLPPCKRSLLQHVQRANYQVGIWG